MTGLRLLLYLVDTISQRIVVARVLRSNVDLVIFDRYIYDELANLTLGNSLIRAYVRLIMKFVPRPAISYLLDADPAVARARKPEYPLDFLYVNRQSYLDLNQLIGIMTVIAPMPVEETKRVVSGHVFEWLSFRVTEHPTDEVAFLKEKSDEAADRERTQTGPAVS
jgi:thymidylate kinase